MSSAPDFRVGPPAARFLLAVAVFAVIATTGGILFALGTAVALWLWLTALAEG